MEASHSLQASESFSYSWLPTEPKIASNTCRHFFDDELEAQNNFDFDISNSKSSFSELVHADKLFSNGLIMPRSCFDNEDDEPSRSPPTTTSRDCSSDQNNAQIVRPETAFRFQKIVFLKKLWCKFPKRVIGKCIKCLIPRRSSSRGVISSNRVDDVNRRAWEVTKSWSNNNNTIINTPEIEDHQEAASSDRRNSAAVCSSAWSDTDESSINEAILYCKRSSSGVCS